MGQYEMVLDYLQRFTRNHAQNMHGKPIAIWGAGNYGRLACCALVEIGLSCKCFIDSAPEKAGSVLFGLPVRTAEMVLSDALNQYFIIVAVASDDEIRSCLAAARGNDGSYLMMCSEIKAEQEAALAALPINQLRTGYGRYPEAVPSIFPILGERHKNDEIRIAPLDGVQTIATNKCVGWLSSGEESLRASIPCLCGSNDFLVLSEKDRYGIPLNVVLCKECGLVMQNPRMSAKGFRIFNEKYFADIVFGVDAQPPEELFFWRKRDASSQIYEISRKYLSPDSAVLEIGCAAGSVVEYFNEMGYKAVGIDLDERYISYGQSRGLELYCCDAESLLPKYEAKFDFIVLEHVLEHLVDLDHELSMVKRLLKPGGYIYMGVPGIKGFSLEYHRFDFLDSLQLMHLYYWDKDTFLQTMRWFGLHAVECDEYISAVLQVGSTISVMDKINYSQDILQFLLHLERHRLSLQKGTYQVASDLK